MTDEPTPSHLLPYWGDRGFLFMPSIPSAYGGEVYVSESSSAEDAYIWLRAEAPANLNEPDGPTVEVAMHLTVENAAKLAEQLQLLVKWHYADADWDERERMKETVWSGGESRRG